MNKKINFDMDGTIADLYGVDGWLDSLINGYTKPYREAKSLVNMRQLSRELNRLQDDGWEINIVSWLSRGGSDEYNERVTIAKQKWLARHIGSVHWDNVFIVKYGTEKNTISSGILFDDEEHNRNMWGEGAYGADNILEILREL